MEARAMEAKKTQTVTPVSPKETVAPQLRVGEFIGDVKEEVWRITWPSADELRTYTQIVVGMTFVLGLGIYCADLVIQTLLNSISIILRWIAG